MDVGRVNRSIGPKETDVLTTIFSVHPGVGHKRESVCLRPLLGVERLR